MTGSLTGCSFKGQRTAPTVDCVGERKGGPTQPRVGAGPSRLTRQYITSQSKVVIL